MTTQLSQAAELLSRWDAASTPNELGLHNAGGFAQHNCVEIREAFRGLLTALSTPPADDVREALADVQWMEHGGVGRRDEWKRLGYAGAVAISRAFEVRPRGTVTAEAREAEMRELHHFEVEQQLAETIAIVKRAQAVVLRHEHTPASLHMDDILNEVNTEIPSAAEVRPRGTVTDATPPADDVREALANALSEAMGYGSLSGWGDSSHVRHMHERVDAILAAFEVRPRGTVTPPADDVREALVALLINERGMKEGIVADRLLAEFEVRPRGTVTDAADDMNRVSLYTADGLPRTLDDIRAEAARKRAATDAAREARS